ncbi:MAG: peroxiredoxin family protein [Bacteroidales bacterium]|nr:peroxiredoxin family protein [Bacteroidales bacterium]
MGSIIVFTVETHDRYRGRVMVGKELDPSYWFSKKSFHEAYTEKIWWPHLLDRAGAIGAMYGADPLAFAVHAEYINRPVTVIIDKNGIVRFQYRGTFWGDRPTIEQTLKMIETGDFSFEHPQRLKL